MTDEGRSGSGGPKGPGDEGTGAGTSDKADHAATRRPPATIARASPFDRTYDEAVTLLVEARNYIAHKQPEDQNGLTEEARLQLSLETMRLTARLTQVMAWLLAHKAHQAGELDRSVLIDGAYSLNAEGVCRDQAGETDERLPAGVRGLLARTRALYERVYRLDSMVRSENTG